MILIIDTGDKDNPNVRLHDNDHIALNGTFHLVARFEILDRDDDGEATTIRDLPTK